MSKVQQAQAFFASREGGEMVCVENTYIPGRAGVRLRLKHVGKSVADGIVLEDPSGRMTPGQSFRCTMPTLAREIVSLSDDEITYALDGKAGAPERLAGHTVTYRKPT